MATIKIYPTSDLSITSTGITITNSDSTTTNLYSYIDEETLSTTDYVNFDWDNTGRDSNDSYLNFDLSSLPLSVSISNVKVVMEINVDMNKGSDRVYIEFKTTNMTNSDYQELGSFYDNNNGDNTITKNFDKNPKTSSNWVSSDLDDITIYIYNEGYTYTHDYVKIYQLYLEITYTVETNRIIGMPAYKLDDIVGIPIFTGTTGFTSVDEISDYTIDMDAPDFTVGAGYLLSIFSDESYGWTCGLNTEGQLGINTAGIGTSKCSPVTICGNHAFCYVDCGKYEVFGIDKNGQAWGWGKNAKGGIGDNSITSKRTPVAVCGNHTFVNLSGGYEFCMAIDKNGQAWGWGLDDYYQLGDDNTLYVSKITPVAVYGNHTFCKIATIKESKGSSYGIDNNGILWAWGWNDYGTIGDNTIIDRSTPVAVCGNHTFCEISAGGEHVIGIDNNGQAWAWGLNAYGQLGNNSIASRRTPVAVCGNHTFCKIESSLRNGYGIDKNGQVWSWGDGSLYQLGDASTISKRTPITVCGTHTFCNISSFNYHILSIDNNYKVWAWGDNLRGQLGDNTRTNRCTPVAVCGLW